jgi:hypothetical protein
VPAQATRIDTCGPQHSAGRAPYAAYHAAQNPGWLSSQWLVEARENAGEQLDLVSSQAQLDGLTLVFELRKAARARDRRGHAGPG